MTPAEIKALRERLGLTWRTFALRVGVHWGTIYRWETGRNSPRGLQLRELQRLQQRTVR